MGGVIDVLQEKQKHQNWKRYVGQIISANDKNVARGSGAHWERSSVSRHDA